MHGRHRRARFRAPGFLRSIAVGVLVGLAVGLFTALAVAPAPATADSSSAQTIAAASQDQDIADAPFPDLKVTVSQTRDLLAQGISVSWTGGKKSDVPNQQTGGANFLQLAQCWGTDAAGGPDRTTCQYGAFLTPGATRDANRASDAEVAPQDAGFSVPAAGFASPAYTSIPFTARDGRVVRNVVDGKVVAGVDVNTNQFFTAQTSNEVSWAGSGSNGEGSAKFELQTSVQQPALGCGDPTADGTGASCWLVVIPRGTADSGEQNIVHSGLFWDTWKHRIAFKLDFKPVATRCAIGASEQQLAGSELVSDAVASWQPTLCSAKGGSAYTTLISNEGDAVSAANSVDGAPLALTSRALEVNEGVTDTLQYAPIALTGVTIAFAVDRQPDAFKKLSQDVRDRARLPFTSMKLTPRLVAKLLTDSYTDALPPYADRSHIGYRSSSDVGKNAENLTKDPDFLAINDPEWADQSIAAASLADLLEPQGRSDVAVQLWKYVTADPDARDFLAGKPDPWGMIVNPWSSTDGKVNPSGVGLALPRADFPKADPVEQPTGASGGPVNLVTWRPYTNDLATSAYLVLRGDGQLLGQWDPQATPPKYGKAARSLPGLQRVLGLTDTGSASRYQVYSAALLNPAGRFVLPTSDAMSTAAAAMTQDAGQSQVMSFEPSTQQAKAAQDAYPLTMPVYAAASPALTDATKRDAYATFIEYAAGDGQRPGTSFGQLPAGYAPIPEGWRGRALSAAAAIRAGATAPSGSGATPDQQLETEAFGDPSDPTAGGDAGFDLGSGSFPASENSTGGGSVDGAATSSSPSATGLAAGRLTGARTPGDPSSALGAAVPAGALSGLACVVALPLLSRLRRRS